MRTEYHKIQNVFERDSLTNKLLPGVFKTPEFEYLSKLRWIATEKIDGMNVRVEWDGSSINFYGRTDAAQMPANLLAFLTAKFMTDGAYLTFSAKFPGKHVVIYGEGYGAGIQSGGKYSSEQEFIVFDVKVNDTFLERGNLLGVCELFELHAAPIVFDGSLDDIVEYVKSQPVSSMGGFAMEGVVAKPAVELTNRFGERVIVKVKCKDFVNK